MLIWTYDGVANAFTVVVRDGMTLIPTTIEKVWVNLPDQFATSFDEIEDKLKNILIRSFGAKFLMERNDASVNPLIEVGAQVMYMRERVTGQLIARHVWACCSQLLEPLVARSGLGSDLTQFRLNLRTGVRLHRVDYEYVATSDEAKGLVARSLVKARVPLGVVVDTDSGDPVTELLASAAKHYDIDVGGGGPTGKSNERAVQLVGYGDLSANVADVGWAIVEPHPKTSTMSLSTPTQLSLDIGRLQHIGCKQVGLALVADVIISH